MRSQESRGSGRRRGARRPSRQDHRDHYEVPHPATARQGAAPQTLWQKIVGFFKPAATKSSNGSYPKYEPRSSEPQRRPVERAERAERAPRQTRKPEAVEVTSTKLYIGNLSYDATENDLHELFKGVGAVASAEIVSHKGSEKSKGFGFVTMSTMDEARRAVDELHDKEFMGRKLVVSGAKTPA